MEDMESTLVQLGQLDKEIINRTVAERSLGGKGFSVALRMIIREWDALTNKHPQTDQPTPAPASAQQ